MTTRQFNESVNAEIRRMTNKARIEEIVFGRHYDGTVCWHADVCHLVPKELSAQQGEPTSFSAWLKANGDSIEMPLDRTESATKWFDDKAKDEAFLE